MALTRDLDRELPALPGRELAGVGLDALRVGAVALDEEQISLGAGGVDPTELVSNRSRSSEPAYMPVSGSSVPPATRVTESPRRTSNPPLAPIEKLWPSSANRWSPLYSCGTQRWLLRRRMSRSSSAESPRSSESRSRRSTYQTFLGHSPIRIRVARPRLDLAAEDQLAAVVEVVVAPGRRGQDPAAESDEGQRFARARAGDPGDRRGDRRDRAGDQQLGFGRRGLALVGLVGLVDLVGLVGDGRRLDWCRRLGRRGFVALDSDSARGWAWRRPRPRSGRAWPARTWRRWRAAARTYRRRAASRTTT